MPRRRKSIKPKLTSAVGSLISAPARFRQRRRGSRADFLRAGLRFLNRGGRNIPPDPRTVDGRRRLDAEFRASEARKRLRK